MESNRLNWAGLVCLIILPACCRPNVAPKDERRTETIQLEGKITFLKGWGIETSTGWMHLAGPLIEKLNKLSSGRNAKIEGHWIESTRSLDNLPPGDQGADPSLWGYIEVTKLELVAE